MAPDTDNSIEAPPGAAGTIRAMARQARLGRRQGAGRRAQEGAGRLRGPAARCHRASPRSLGHDRRGSAAASRRPARAGRSTAATAEEELAEAEVRHTVGEFTDDEWRADRRRERAAAGWSAGATEDGAGVRSPGWSEVQRLDRRVPPKPAAPAPPRGHRALDRPPPCRAAGRPAEPVVPRLPRLRPAPTPQRAREPEPAAGGRARLPQVGDRRAPKRRAGDGRPSNPVRSATAPQASARGRGDRAPRALGQGRRSWRGQDAQVRRVRHAQPADGVVLRAVWGGAGGDLMVQ